MYDEAVLTETEVQIRVAKVCLKALALQHTHTT